MPKSIVIVGYPTHQNTDVAQIVYSGHDADKAQEAVNEKAGELTRFHGLNTEAILKPWFPKVAAVAAEKPKAQKQKK
jgi:hypothetical protein